MTVRAVLLVVMLAAAVAALGRQAKQVRLQTNRYRHAITMVSTDNDVRVRPTKSRTSSFVDSAAAATLASTAVTIATAVNQAVSMKALSAPDSDNTYVYFDGASENRKGKVDDKGLPLVYNKELIEKYWKAQQGALTSRWTEFLGYSVPFLTRVITILATGGSAELASRGATLARDARIIMEKLGPTYIKLGQMMSVRPDVLPKEALNELKILQDSVKPFDTAVAVSVIEAELGGPLGQFFSEISSEPVAAASLAQVYRARLNSTGEYVAIKVQRPEVLETVSKDLYVLRRAAEVYQGLVERFAPQQRTNYVALLNEWAVGFYTELDFLNEKSNQQRMRDMLIAEGVTSMYIPRVYHDLCSRRVMVSEWVDGKKLSDPSIPPEQLRALTDDAQNSFLTQLLKLQFFHSDPHPGNIMLMDEERDGARLALLDFGLVASIRQEDADVMVSAIIHLANKDYPSLVDDFIKLQILPSNCDRSLVVPLMNKALSPYVKGGGAQAYEAELMKIYGMDEASGGGMAAKAGGFSQMTQDALTVLNDIPFSIPPYFALLARAIVTLEGIALTGNPNYGIILEAYPFVARSLLSADRPEIQKALEEVLYASRDAQGLKGNRLSVLINSALGKVARGGGAFVDFDALPEDSVSFSAAAKLVLSDKSSTLRTVLEKEAVGALDILLRQAARKGFNTLVSLAPRIPFLSSLLPPPDAVALDTPFPLLLPPSDPTSSQWRPSIVTNRQLLQSVAPELSREEMLYAISLSDIATQLLGPDAGAVANGDLVLNPQASLRFLLQLLRSPGGSGFDVGRALAAGLNIGAPLSIPDGARDASQALLSALTGGQAASGNKDFSELMGQLDDAEAARLTESAATVVGALRERTAARLALL